MAFILMQSNITRELSDFPILKRLRRKKVPKRLRRKKVAVAHDKL
jgi:hypothetical protein